MKTGVAGAVHFENVNSIGHKEFTKLKQEGEITLSRKNKPNSIYKTTFGPPISTKKEGDSHKVRSFFSHGLVRGHVHSRADRITRRFEGLAAQGPGPSHASAAKPQPKSSDEHFIEESKHSLTDGNSEQQILGSGSDSGSDLIGESSVHKYGAIYKGKFVNGKLQGQGTYTDANGNVSEGEFVEGKLHGEGRLTYKNSHVGLDVYEGKFVKGRPCGGILTYQNGDVYEGGFQYGRPGGKGTLTYQNGDVYEGDWPRGKGVLTYQDGDVYEGDVVNGMLNKSMPHGKGTLISQNGDVYKGKFSNGEPGGKGTLTYQNGDVYEGTFSNGERHGRGMLTYQNGNVYEGNFRNGKISITTETLNKLVTNFILDKADNEGISKYYSFGDRGARHANHLLANTLSEIDQSAYLKNEALNDQTNETLSCCKKLIRASAGTKETLSPDELIGYLEKLQPGESYLMCSGCEQHRTQVLFEKSSNNTYSITHYNTGYGREEDYSGRVQPFQVASGFTLDQLKKERICDKIIGGHYRSGENFIDLWKDIAKASPSGKFDDFPASQLWTQSGQESGTCVVSSMYAFIHHQILKQSDFVDENQAAYKGFKYEFRQRILTTLSAEIDDNKPDSEAERIAQNRIVQLAEGKIKNKLRPDSLL
jgi:hypothetical protein